MNNPMKILNNAKVSIPYCLKELLEAKARIYNSWEPSLDDIAIEERVTKLIYKVKREDCRQLLRLRYIECKTFDQIAGYMDYSLLHIVHRMHKRALKEFEKIQGEMK